MKNVVFNDFSRKKGMHTFHFFSNKVKFAVFEESGYSQKDVALELLQKVG